MGKSIKLKKDKINVESGNDKFKALTSSLSSTLKSSKKKTNKGGKEGEALVELVRAITKESTKSFRPEFAEAIGLTESGLNSALYQRNITGKHLANFLLQLTNTTAEEFVELFFQFAIEKKQKETPEWLTIFRQMKNLNDEEKKYLALMGLKFDQMIENRKK